MIQYITDHWMEITLAAGAVIFAFDRVARLTPTKTDDKVVATLYRLASILSIRVPDNPGKD